MTSKQFADSLREMATFYEQHPDMPAPLYGNRILVNVDDRATLARAARLLAPCDKQVDPGNAGYYSVIRRFGQLKLEVYAVKARVCERKLAYVKHHPETVLPARVVPAFDEEVYEWNCNEPLLASDEPPKEDTP